MRILVRIGLALLVLLAGLLGLIQVASETGEVVILETRSADGSASTTRLWVVDHDGSAWLRAGSSSAGWLPDLGDQVAVTRDNIRRRYTPIVDATQRDTINALMAKKYGWRESVISAIVASRESSTPIRLEPER